MSFPVTIRLNEELFYFVLTLLFLNLEVFCLENASCVKKKRSKQKEKSGNFISQTNSSTCWFAHPRLTAVLSGEAKPCLKLGDMF